MKKQIIQFFTVFILVSSLFATCNAQDYLTGQITNGSTGEHQIYYDRTQYEIGISIFQTVYKVTDLNKKRLYTITLTHDQFKGVLYLAVKEEAGPSIGTTLHYNSNECGLILSNKDNINTEYKISDAYDYLLSFADADRDYPVLHKIKVGDANYIVLDPISKLCLKKHNEIVKALSPKIIAEAARNRSGQAISQKDTLIGQLLHMRDSLYSKSAMYYESIAELRNNLQIDIKHYFDETKVYDNESRYEGETKKGKPDGKGLKVENGNIFDGIFSKAVFVSGSVVLRKGDSEYYGQYSAGAMNGSGWLKYKNGNFWLGVFANGKLGSGIALSKEANGEVYFGTYQNNQRNGYGELRNPQGNSYYGEFQEGRLVKGFAKEVDQFGYSTYSRIDNGTKKTIEAQEAGEFFNTNLYVKK